MSAHLLPIEPLTASERRWFGLLLKDDMDRSFVLGMVGTTAAGAFVGGLLGLTLAGWAGGIVLMAIGLPVVVVVLLLVRFAHQHGRTVTNYSWDFFGSPAHPKAANAALRALAEEDFTLARSIGKQYWATLDNQDKVSEVKLRKQLLELHEALKDRQRLEARVSGRGDLETKLQEVREFNEDVCKLLQKEV